jgi:hypothetical protein
LRALNNSRNDDDIDDITRTARGRGGMALSMNDNLGINNHLVAVVRAIIIGICKLNFLSGFLEAALCGASFATLSGGFGLQA